MSLKEKVIKLLRETADKIDAGNSELSESEAMDIMRVLCHESISKAQACIYLNLRRAQFDNLVRAGKLPKGRKVTGFTELRWYKDDLDRYKQKDK
jgi:predicted DNA-binding transcriptional regulator AlpA